ncbi:protein kinase activating protein dpb11, partial [Kickxella alabastrina]
EELHHRIEQLGGTISHSLTTVVTHLVAKSSKMSNKYQIAAKVGIPVVSLNFVGDCEVEARNRLAAMRHPNEPGGNGGSDSDRSAVRLITQRNRIAPFSGCRVCTTGFNAEVRDEISKFVTQTHTASGESTLFPGGSTSTRASEAGASDSPNFLSGGGTYHRELTHDCTHLIVQTPSGEKFKFAKHWGLYVVSLDWILDCANSGFRQKESEYSIEVARSAAAQQPNASIPPSLDYAPESSFSGTSVSAQRHDQLFSRNGSAASVGTVIPQSRTADSMDLTSYFDRERAGSRALSRNNTAAGSVSSDFVEIQFRAADSMLDDFEGFVDDTGTTNQNQATVGSSAAARSPPLPPQSPDMAMLFDTCRIALSEASLGSARRKDWYARIAATGGVCILDDAANGNTRHSKARGTHESGLLKCTHFVADDSGKLCDWDIAILQLMERASSPNEPGNTERPYSATSSVLQLDRPAIVKYGWLRACWQEKRRVSEQSFQVPWPQSAAMFLERRTDSDPETRTKASSGASYMTRGRPTSAIGAQVDAKLPPPHPRYRANSRALLSAGSADNAKRASASKSLVGKAFDGGRISDSEPDPFMDDAVPVGHRSIGSDDEHTASKAMKRKEPWEPLVREIKRQTISPDALGTVKAFEQSPGVPPQKSSPQTKQSTKLADFSAQSRYSTLIGSKSGRNQTTVSRKIQAIEVDSDDHGSDNVSAAVGGAEDSIFAKCVFLPLGLSSTAVDMLKMVVGQNGGKCVDLEALLPVSTDSPRKSDVILESEVMLRRALTAAAGLIDGRSVADVYITIQLSGMVELPCCEDVAAGHSSMHIVTECWVEQCLEDNKRLPDYNAIASQAVSSTYPGLSKGQHVLFRPLWSTQIGDAEKLNLSISGYETIERDHVGKLARALAIPYSEKFSRKTTHLICRPPFKGPKYDRAVKWGIAVVESTWLYDLALNARPKMPVKVVCVLPENTYAQTPVSKGYRGKQPELFVGVQNTVTPVTRSVRNLGAGTPGRTPMEVALERNLQRALGINNSKLKQPNASASDDYDDDSTQMSPTHDSHMPMSGGEQLVSDNFLSSDASAGADAEIGVNANASSGGASRVLKGVVVAMTTRLHHRLGEITPLALQLGCRVLNRFDASQVTHLVHQSSREREILKDYRTALENKIAVVSPWWLYACRDTMTRVPEAEFPFNFKPERRLKLVATPPARPLQTPTFSSTTSGASKVPSVKITLPLSSSIGAGNGISLSATTLSGLTGSLRASAGASTAIDSLFVQKASRAGRRYRQAATTPEGSKPSAAEIDTAARPGSVRFNVSAQPQRISGRQQDQASANAPATGNSGERNSSATSSGTPASPDSEVSFNDTSRQSSMQTPSKWWLNVDPPVGAGFGSGNQMRLYSQDFQLSGDKSLDSMPSTGMLNETQHFLGPAVDMSFPVTPGLARPNSSHEAGVNDGLWGRAQDMDAFPQGQNVASAGLKAPRANVNTLTAQRTTIVYEEDARALSEREQLLARLSGR